MLSKTFYAKKYDFEKNKNYHFHRKVYFESLLPMLTYFLIDTLLKLAILILSTYGNMQSTQMQGVSIFQENGG